MMKLTTYKIALFLCSIMLLAGWVSVRKEMEDQTVSIPLQIPYFKESAPTFYWPHNKPYSKAEVNCMALNIYFEARGEPIKGQYAIAEVVMNRVSNVKFPNTICGVVKEAQYYNWNPKIVIRHECQFSWYCDGKPDKPIDGDAFETAMEIAHKVLSPYYTPKFPYALYYHATYVHPTWAKKKQYVAKIDNHLFYR